MSASTRLPTLALALLAAAALLPAPAHAYPRTLSCDYLEAGPPGPAGNVLEIAGNDNAQVRRDGDLVLVGTSAANGPRDFEPIDCGTQATLTNLDRIVYRGKPTPPRTEHQFLLDLRGGQLSPGATPEPNDPEIEVQVILPPQRGAHPRVQLLAGDGRDDIRLRAEGGSLEVRLEPRPPARGFTPDPDLTIDAPPRTVELKVHAGGGGDVLDARALDYVPSASGGPGPHHLGRPLRSLLLAGDDGRDVLLGTAHGDHLEGGSGPDALYGRGGRDTLYPRRGDRRPEQRTCGFEHARTREGGRKISCYEECARPGAEDVRPARSRAPQGLPIAI